MSTKVPPDGGYGWAIVVAYALNNLTTIPLIAGFGLIFKDSLAALGLTATDISIIMNINFAFGMILGLINGPLLKKFGYRKMAATGSILFTTGITLTAFANTFSLIVISYGLLASFGMGMSLSAFSLAINSYFTKNRGRAVGVAMTITGLGPIIIPQITSFLLLVYGIQGTILLFGAYALHSLIGAMLLQPVKWHMKNAPICLETFSKSPDNEEAAPNHNIVDETNICSSSTTVVNGHQTQRKKSIMSIDHDVEVGNIYGFDAALPRQTSVETKINDLNYDTEMPATNNWTSITNLYDSRVYYPRWNSANSINSVNLGSCIKIFDEPAVVTKKLSFINNDNSASKSNHNIKEKESLLEEKAENDSTEKDHNNDNGENKSAIRRILQSVADMYDLDLLRDPIYVNLMLGMSIAIFAEANFTLLMPFILADMNITTARIASALSILAATDLCSRGVAPFLGEWLRQPPRIMYLLSLCLLIISRTSLIFVKNFTTLLVTSAFLGVAKGIRSVYMVLVVPSYVSIQKLPSASAIQMVTNGIILTCAGPFLGILRDVTGSYIPCIILINSVTAVTVIMWLTEIILIRRKSARISQKISQSPENP